MPLNSPRAVILLAAALLLPGCWFHAKKKPQVQTVVTSTVPVANFFGYVQHGDKPAVGLRLQIRDGEVRAGTFGIYNPDYPGNPQGAVSVLLNVMQQRNVVTFHALVNNDGQAYDLPFQATILSYTDQAMTVELRSTDGTDDEVETMTLTREN